MLDVLERIGCGGLLLDGDGDVLAVNETAKRLLAPNSQHGADHRPVHRRTINALLRPQGSTRLPLDTACWHIVPREEKRQLIVHATPIMNGAERANGTLLMIIDLEESPRPTQDVLKRIFGLTRAEAQLAIALSSGSSLDEIAETRDHQTIGTLRKHLAAIFEKTRTNRQAELVALLARTAILP